MTPWVVSVLPCSNISTHILTKRMTGCPFCPLLQSESFQLTSSRRGWQSPPRRSFMITVISTHILTKRMTPTDEWKNIYHNISTHILTKRMTNQMFFHCWVFSISTHILTKRMTFFPRRPACDITISTHILTKRMTLCSSLASVK